MNALLLFLNITGIALFVAGSFGLTIIILGWGVGISPLQEEKVALMAAVGFLLMCVIYSLQVEPPRLGL